MSHYEYDVLIGADGKRNTLEGFRRKEFRGKLAIAITANFINKRTEAEAKVSTAMGGRGRFQPHYWDCYKFWCRRSRAGQSSAYDVQLMGGN